MLGEDKIFESIKSYNESVSEELLQQLQMSDN